MVDEVGKAMTGVGQDMNRMPGMRRGRERWRILGNVMMERVPTRRACRKNKQPLETATCIAGKLGGRASWRRHAARAICVGDSS